MSGRVVRAGREAEDDGCTGGGWEGGEAFCNECKGVGAGGTRRVMSVRWLRLEGEVLYNDSKGGRRALCYGNYRKAAEVNEGGPATAEDG